MTLRSDPTIEMVAATGLSTLLSLGYVVVTGRLLSPSQYADFAAGLAVLYLLGTAASPIAPTAAHYVARYAAAGDSEPIGVLWTRGIRALLAGAAIAAGLGSLAALPAARVLRFHSPASLIAVSVAAALTAVLLFERGLLQGLMLFRRYNVNSLLEAAVRVVAGLLLLIWSRSAAAALAAYAIAAALAAVGARPPVSNPRGASSAVPEWSAIGRFFASTAFFIGAYALFQNLDMLAAKRWLSPVDAGRYGAAAALVRSIGIAVWPLNTLAVPVLTSHAAAGRSVIAPSLRLAAWFVVLTTPIVVAFFLAPLSILSALFGSDFAPAAPILGPLAGAAAVTTFNLLVGIALAALREFRFVPTYLAAAVIQAVLFAVFHRSGAMLISVMYAVQVPLFAVMLLYFFWRAVRAHRPG